MRPSGRTRRRRVDAERSVAAIVEAAVELLSHRPEANMTEIASAAGVGRVTLYAHFPSRDAVLAAARDRALAETIEAIDAAELDRGPAPEALRRLIRGAWSVLDRHRGVLAAGGITATQQRVYHAGVLDRIDGLIRRGQTDGLFRADLTSGWLVAVCYGLFHAAAEEVNAARLGAADAPAVLESTLIGVLAASHKGESD